MLRNVSYYYDKSVKESYLFVGSIGRQTDIHKSDIDVIYKLPSEYYYKYNAYLSNGQSQMLQDFKKVVLQAYSRTTMKADGLVVVVSFSDGMQFEIMPAFQENDNSFTFPVSTEGGFWRKTDPIPEIHAMNEVHRSTSSNAKKIARMVRAWKGQNDVPMGGLLIDTYVERFIKNYTHKNESYFYYDFFTRDFFEFLSKQENSSLFIHALGSNQRIYLCGNFVRKASEAHNHALTAIDEWNNANYLKAGERYTETC